MATLQSDAFREAGGEFNLGSPKQLGVILYEQLKLPVLGKTPKGEPSTAEDVLEELAATHPLPRVILDWRALQRSEERRVGKECVSTCRSWWSPSHSKKNKEKRYQNIKRT